MKKLITLFFICSVLCSCSFNATSTPDIKDYSYKITAENYQTFFRSTRNNTYKKINVEPLFNKHLDYSNVVFVFESIRYSEPNYAISINNRSVRERKTINIRIDETGNGSESFTVDGGLTYSADYYDVVFVSVKGNVSFKEDYSMFKEIASLQRDNYHREDISVFYNTSGAEKWILRFKVDYNVSQTPDTDAFYLVESVKVKFKATVNNALKECEYEFQPDFFGTAEIKTNDTFNEAITNLSCEYTNGYYLAY